MQSEINKRLSGLEERVRILESRIEEISTRFESFRMNAIKNQKEHSEKIKTLIGASAELKRRTDEFREVLKRVERKLLRTASREDLQALDAYLKLLNPLNLVTRGELERMLKEKEGD